MASEQLKSEKKQRRESLFTFILYFNARYFMLLLEYMEIKFLFARRSVGFDIYSL